jgi:hypothetical protein
VSTVEIYCAVTLDMIAVFIVTTEAKSWYRRKIKPREKVDKYIDKYTAVLPRLSSWLPTAPPPSCTTLEKKYKK